MSGGAGIETGETREQVLGEVRAAGFSLSDSQLARRHRAGLIARPRTRSLGRGKGSVSVYPPGTGRRLVRMLGLARGRDRFENVAWRAWWEDGGEPGPLVRERLLREGARWEAELSRLGDLLAREEAEDPDAVTEMDRAYLAASCERMPTSLGRLRGNVGRERFATVFRVFAEVASGRFAGYPDEESEAAVERALRIDRARSDRLNDGEPWFEGSSADDFRRLSAVFEAIGPLVRSAFEPEAFGFGTIGAVFAGQAEEDQPFFVLMWLALREDPELQAGMAAVTAALPEALAVREAFESCGEGQAEIVRAISETDMFQVEQE